MKLIPWLVFTNEIEAYTTTKAFGDMSLHNPTIKQTLKNREALSDYLKTPISQMVSPRQTHTANFKEVRKADGNTNMYELGEHLLNIDALYTKDEDLFLWSFHADCTPILLYCRDTKIVASIHSGWPGTTKQITTHLVTHLIENENCNPTHMYAYIGPSISYHNFEVKQDVIDKIRQMNFDTSPFYKKIDTTHYLVDNKGLNRQQLLNLGVPQINITTSPYCTLDETSLLYSHRRKESGRNISMIRRRAKDSL